MNRTHQTCSAAAVHVEAESESDLDVVAQTVLDMFEYGRVQLVVVMCCTDRFSEFIGVCEHEPITTKGRQLFSLRLENLCIRI